MSLKQKFRKFHLTGDFKKNDYSFRIDEVSKNNSKYLYNKASLNFFCGENHGTMNVSMIDGYFRDGSKKIRCIPKDKDGKNDFKSDPIWVAFDDRNNKDILDKIGDINFIHIKIEKDLDGNLVDRKFITQYDAIAYLSEHLHDGDKVSISGNIEYGEYNGNKQLTLTPSYITLRDSDADYRADFTQSVIITPDSFDGKESFNKDKYTLSFTGFVPQYVSTMNGKTIKAIIPYPWDFEFKVPKKEDKEEQKNLISKIAKYYLKTKTIDEIAFDGEFVSGATYKQATMDDLPEDLKIMINCGFLSKEETLAKCTIKEGGETRMVVESIHFTTSKDENGNPVATVYMEKDKYSEEDLEYSEKEEEKPKKTNKEKVEKKMSVEEMLDLTGNEENDDSEFDDLFGDDMEL